MLVSRSELSAVAFDPARELRDGCERNVGVARGQGIADGATADERVGRRADARRRHTWIPSRRWSERLARARPCVARHDARRVAPSSGASSRAAVARSASVIATCASFSASANVAGDTSGPVPGAVPNAGGAPGVAGGVLVPAACRWGRHAATVSPPIAAVIRNCLRVFMHRSYPAGLLDLGFTREFRLHVNTPATGDGRGNDHDGHDEHDATKWMAL